MLSNPPCIQRPGGSRTGHRSTITNLLEIQWTFEGDLHDENSEDEKMDDDDVMMNVINLNERVMLTGFLCSKLSC
jgi:hypothetical protein